MSANLEKQQWPQNWKDLFSLFPHLFAMKWWFTYCWSLAWRILSITLLACEMSAIMQWFEHSLALPFWLMKTDPFQSCGHCWVFHTDILNAALSQKSSFRTWNSSTGILSPPLALFVVMLPKALLTLHSEMSGSRWVITPSWLSGSWRPFWIVLLCILATSS